MPHPEYIPLLNSRLQWSKNQLKLTSPSNERCILFIHYNDLFAGKEELKENL